MSFQLNMSDDDNILFKNMDDSFSEKYPLKSKKS